jgi:hypothetical protein
MIGKNQSFMIGRFSSSFWNICASRY